MKMCNWTVSRVLGMRLITAQNYARRRHDR